MSSFPIRLTNMDKDTYDDIRNTQQVNKYKGLNTYKLKLCSTHADNYVDALASQNPTTQADNKGENNPVGGLRWSLPAIAGNHIQNALIRVISVHIPQSTFNYTILSTDNASLKIDYDTGKRRFDLLYIKSNNVINKTYISSGSGVFPYPALGSKNMSAYYKAHHTGQVEKTADFMELMPIGNESMIDTDFILCNNPFGSTINLELVEPDNLTNVSISSSKDGEDGATLGHDPLGSNNNIIDNPVVYELEVILLPDNQSNDKFSY